MGMIVLKIGGSVFTDKRSGGALINFELLESIALQIRTTLTSHDYLVIVLGGGGLAHSLMKRILTGRLTPAEKQKTAQVVRQALRKQKFEVEIIFRNAGLSSECMSVVGPWLFGTGEFIVLSGDTIVLELAKRLGADKILFASDVPGVLTSSGALIPEIDLNNYQHQSYKDNENDVTGGMLGKLEAIKKYNPQCPVAIFSGLTPSFYHDWILECGIGTRIKNSSR